MKVKFTKIVEKSLEQPQDSVKEYRSERSKILENIFGKETTVKSIGEVTFSDKLGELFGVDEDHRPNKIDG